MYRVHVTDAQGWVLLGLIGVFATAVVTLMMFSMTSLRGEMTSLRNEMTSRFDAMDARLDRLDRDVQALVERVFRRST